jgi:pimeloyl-ACP methyl ester carboxylesterase
MIEALAETRRFRFGRGAGDHRRKAMAYATTDDGVRLYYEETGDGLPIVFVHEFAGDHRSWEPQMRFFGRRYRCIAYAARGYPPSEVPETLESYSQKRAAADVRAVMDGAGIERAHIVGLSMGAFATLHFGLDHSERALSLVAAGVGYGAEKTREAEFRAASEQVARGFETRGSKAFAEVYGSSAARVQLEAKDPRGWREFVDQLGEHSPVGSANTMRGVQAKRPSLYDLEDRFRTLTLPTLIVAGDEDDDSLQPSLFLKLSIPASGLLVLPKTGHTINLEEPDLFNRGVADFLAQVTAGRWGPRDPRARPDEILKTS